MTPFNLSFRYMLRKYIPQLTDENIEEHEKLLTYRYVLQHELNFVPKKYLGYPGQNETEQNDSEQYKESINKRIISISKQARTIIEPYKEEFEALHKLWIARRKFALEQGHFLQIPPTLQGLGRYIRAAIHYQNVQIRTLPKLWINRLKHSIKNLSLPQIVIIVGLTLLIIAGLVAANSQFNGKPPVVSGIPDQTIKQGRRFKTIPLDDYVSDPDNSADDLKWSYSGNKELAVTIDTNRVATIGIPDLRWTGTETISFSATDPDGLSDSDTAMFVVTAVNDTIYQNK